MTTPEPLPTWLSNALASIPWPVNVALVFAIGAALVLLLAHAWDRLVVDPYFERIERETQTGKYRPPSEVERHEAMTRHPAGKGLHAPDAEYSSFTERNRR